MALISVFRFLFRLSADATELPMERVLGRLVTGLANLYAATTCSVFLRGRDAVLASAAPDESVAKLDPEDRKRFLAIERALATKTLESNDMASALDLDDGAAEFLNQAMGVADMFSFPLLIGAEATGALVLCLGPNADSLGDADIQALTAVGEVLKVVQEATAQR